MTSIEFKQLYIFIYIILLFYFVLHNLVLFVLLSSFLGIFKIFINLIIFYLRVSSGYYSGNMKTKMAFWLSLVCLF